MESPHLTTIKFDYHLSTLFQFKIKQILFQQIINFDHKSQQGRLFSNVFLSHQVGQNQHYIFYILWQLMKFLFYFFEWYLINHLQQHWVCLRLNFQNPNPRNLLVYHFDHLQCNYYHHHFLFHHNGECLQVYTLAGKK